MSIIQHNDIVFASCDEILITLRHLADRCPNIRNFVPFGTGVYTIMYVSAEQVDRMIFLKMSLLHIASDITMTIQIIRKNERHEA